MAELRLVGVSEDGQHLLLADDSGDQHTIAIDERLRAGVNGHLSRLGQLTMALESRISPREIQERVRSGESAEHVAVTAGVPLERVLRFVGPVLREREHVAEQGRVARLGGSSGPSLLLVDVIARACARLRVDPEDVVWDSARREDHSWVVTVTFPDDDVAAFALDLTRHQATPVDAVARKISGLGDDTPVTLPRAIDLDAELVVEGFPDEDDAATVRPFVPRAVPDSPIVSARSGGSGGAVDDEPDDAPEDFSETAPIVREPAHRGPKKRADDAKADDRKSRGSRRARVPKWDDIMFGPKSKD